MNGRKSIILKSNTNLWTVLYVDNTCAFGFSDYYAWTVIFSGTANLTSANSTDAGRVNCSELKPSFFFQVENSYDIAVFERSLFVSSWRNSSVIRLDKYNPKRADVVGSFSRPFSLKVFHRQQQPDGKLRLCEALYQYRGFRLWDTRNRELRNSYHRCSFSCPSLQSSKRWLPAYLYNCLGERHRHREMYLWTGICQREWHL